MPYIPDSVFESKTWEKISPHSKLVYVALCKFYNRKERKAFPGISRIMQVSGCSRRSVFRALNELKTKIENLNKFLKLVGHKSNKKKRT